MCMQMHQKDPCSWSQTLLGLAWLLKNYEMCKGSSDHPTNFQTAVTTPLTQYADLELFISLLWGEKNCQTRMVQNRWTTEEDWWIHNKLLLPWEVAAGLHFKISLSILFPQPFPTFLSPAPRPIFHLTADLLVCAEVEGWLRRFQQWK